MQNTLPLLYSFRRCPYAIRARLALHASKINYNTYEVSLKNKPKSLIQYSPKAQVPVLVINDNKIIDESYYIMIWALKQNDPQKWLPSSKDSWQHSIKLIETNDKIFKIHLDICKYKIKYSDDIFKKSKCAAYSILTDWNEILKKQCFFNGEKLGLADIAILPFVRQFSKITPDIFSDLEVPLLKEWLSKLLDTQLFKDIMKKQ